MTLPETVRDEPSLPRRNGELVFDAPWQSRAFSVAVALTEAGRWSWDAFRDRLVGEIGDWEAGAAGDPDAAWDYYAHWLAALERALLEEGVLAADELEVTQARLAHEALHEHDDHGHADHDHDHGHHHGPHDAQHGHAAPAPQAGAGESR